MNRQEFLRRLESLLMNIPEHERLDALAYYSDYFDEAGIENEQLVIQELGSPEQVAQSITADAGNSGYSESFDYEDPSGAYEQSSYPSYTNYQDSEKKSKFKTWQIVLIVILLIITSPVLIGVVAGLFGGLLGLLGGLFGILVGIFGSALGLVIGGIALSVAGVLHMIVSPIEGVTSMGVGLLMTAIGILLALLFVLLTFVWLPKLVKAIIGWVKGLFHRNEGGNEI